MAAKLLTTEMFDTHWPEGDDAMVAGIIATQAEAFALANINTDLRLAHFLAQISHECGGGTVFEENLTYSAERLMEVWPNRFPTMLAATAYAHNPQALANKTYNGRNGNRIGSTDGFEFRGRGILQITGRDNYFAIGAALDLDLVARPESALDPRFALKCAAVWWKQHNANGAADDDSVQRVTRIVNGGLDGLADRQERLGKWKQELGIQ